MSIIDDQVRRLDATLDRILLTGVAVERVEDAEDQVGQEPVNETDTQAQNEEGENTEASSVATSPKDTPETIKLKTLARTLSTTAGSRPLLKRRRLRDALVQINSANAETLTTSSEHEQELQWVAVGKATIQVYGAILNTLLGQTIPLNESIWYWDDVLGSNTYTALYTIQTTPGRWWKSTQEIYADARARYLRNHPPSETAQEVAHDAVQGLSEGWKEFYKLVDQSIRDRSLATARKHVLSPFALCRTEARKKQEQIEKLRWQSATAIGLLVEECLSFQEHEPEPLRSTRHTIAKSISLLEAVATHSQSVKSTWTDFEDSVVDLVDRGPIDEAPSQLVQKLLHILDEHIPKQETESLSMVKQYGKPSRWVRYWIPGIALLLSGGTLLKFLMNRRAEIVIWIQEAGTTTIDFWDNWVVEPAKRLLGTIRHDENSELAVMSKDSLRSDRDSLERMVIDFAVQNPENGTAYTEAQITDLRTRIRQGDLTAVLKAYEKEIQSPARGAIFGNLVRTLLIQVQKTKVDVEVAMNGIDEILKSQELLFGFVGLAPGMVVSWLAFRWVAETFGGRKGAQQMRQQGDTVRLIRNIDRTLSTASLTPEGILSYKDNGLLLCEVHVLRQTAIRLLPGNLHREFIQDLDDLMSIRRGVEPQQKVLDRIQWAYGKWLK